MTAYNLKLFEQKYFPKRFPHKISSEAIKNNQMDVLKEYDEKMKLYFIAVARNLRFSEI